MVNGGYGGVNKILNYETYMTFTFDDASDFENGLADILLGSEWITIDKETLYENQSIKY